MLDLRFVCDNIDYVSKKLALRNSNLDLTELSELASERRRLITTVETLKAEKNQASALVAQKKRNKENCDDIILAMKQKGEEIKELDARLAEVEARLTEIMYVIPNIVDDSLPVGKDDSDNLEIRRFSTPREFDFTLLSHWEIGESKKIFRPDQAGKITGTRFTVYHGIGARLERAVINYMLDTHNANGYEEVLPPFMVNKDSMLGTGQLPKFEEDMYAIKNTDFYLVPTAEVP